MQIIGCTTDAGRRSRATLVAPCEGAPTFQLLLEHIKLKPDSPCRRHGRLVA